MNRFWKLRDELYNSLHQWPTLILFFIIGCLIGWGFAFVVPSSYRAVTEIYVGLNPYRVHSDTQFQALVNPRYSNVDDYKNWQMAQLESVIFLDVFIQETLFKLRKADQYWEDINKKQLRNMLRAEWRTAGKWSLVAENKDQNLAEQAVSAWTEVVMKRIPNAIQDAFNTYLLDEEIQTAFEQSTLIQLRQEELISAQQALQEWTRLEQDSSKDQQPEFVKRWQLLSIVTGLAQFSPDWTMLLDEQPDSLATIDAYLDWISRTMTHIDAELSTIGTQLEMLESSREKLAEQYTIASEKSYGLSPNLAIKGLDQIPPEPIRPTGLLTLIGGIIGILFWIFMQLIYITNKVRDL
ncbi:hypothetical protein ACFLUC_01325 [Chloroflexota bacterium]